MPAALPATAGDGPAASHPEPERRPVDLQALSHDHKHALEDELSYTKQSLQAAIEELEATNEELQATNEELIASNEELQSTNEELHSVNEELYTVNAEYQKKNAELQELNNDIEHLLNGTDVATIFLDRELCIRKFTPRIARDLPGPPAGYRASDPDLHSRFAVFDADRGHRARAARRTSPSRRRRGTRKGRGYFLRILPYRAREKERKDGGVAERQPPTPPVAPDGVVLTLTDISALEQARAKVAQLSAIVESSDDAIVGSGLDGVITSWNNGASRLYGYTSDEAIGRHLSLLQPPGREDDAEGVLSQVRGGRSVERVDTALLRKDGTLVDVSVKFSPIFDGSEAPIGVSAISRDITQLVRARREIAEREERIRLLLDSTAEAIYGIDLSGICIFCNPACARLLGYDSPAALIGRQLHPSSTIPSRTGRRIRQSSLRFTRRCATGRKRMSTTRCCGGRTARAFPPSTGAIRSCERAS